MATGLKGDIINGAYSLMRISGLTVNPSPEDLVLALDRLENMAHEFFGLNICTGYFFEDTPDVNTPHNMERKFWFPFEANLAVRLMPDFGKMASPELLKFQQTGYSFLSSNTAIQIEVPYPSRQPIGAGSSLRFNRLRKYFSPAGVAPIACATVRMFIDDVDDFVEHFDAWLKDGETVTAYTIEADTGLTIVSDSLTTPDIDYRIKAVGNDDSSDSLLQVKIVATTSDSRIVTRVINFTLTEVEI